MEPFTKTCYKCNQNYRECTDFTPCKHSYCQKCLLRTLLKHHMLDLPDKDIITIRCKCKQGTCELTLEQITSILKVPQEITIIPCSNHNKPIMQLCRECKKHLCETCVISHNDLFQDHHTIPINELTSSEKSNQLDNEQCSDHLKDYEAYCKNCKVKLCQICLFGNETHKSHEVITYETYTSKLKEIQDKLQFKTYDDFNEYVTQIETEFDNAYNTNLSNTISTLENIVQLITSTINEYKHSMELKRKKKQHIMNIIKKVYKRYYDDFKIVEKCNNHICLKFLSKQYDEFSEINFKSEFDSITSHLTEITSQLQSEDIASMIKVSYSYFAKRDLVLTTKIKNDKTQKDQITALLELKDGKLLSASEDNSIFVYDASGKILSILKGHISGVKCLCSLPSNRFASGSIDKTIRIWDSKAFKTVSILKQHRNPVISLSLLDGDRMASCSLREIIIYDTNMKAIYFLGQFTHWVRQCIQLDKTRICACCDDGNIIVYDNLCRMICSYKENEELIYSMCRLRDGRLVSGDRAGRIVVWNKEMSGKKQVWEHGNGVMCIKQLKDGRVVTASMDMTVRLWDLDFKVVQVYKAHVGCVNALEILRDGGFASGGADCVVNLFK